MQSKLRTIYAVLFFILLLVELFIGLFVNDAFIRPYVGDMLVTVLICSLCRIFIPTKAQLLPVYVFVFAAIVELGQYFDVIKLLGLENSRILSVAVGRTFSFIDLICYAVGCLAFFVIEHTLKYVRRQ